MVLSTFEFRRFCTNLVLLTTFDQVRSFFQPGFVVSLACTAAAASTVKLWGNIARYFHVIENLHIFNSISQFFIYEILNGHLCLCSKCHLLLVLGNVVSVLCEL